MRAIALVPLLLALTPRGPHGSIGDRELLLPFPRALYSYMHTYVHVHVPSVGSALLVLYLPLLRFRRAAIVAAPMSKRKNSEEPSEAGEEVKASVVDVSAFLADPASPAAKAACAELTASLRKTGIVLLKDVRVSTEDSANFLDMMEDYFAQPEEKKLPDVRAELHYQVGATPSMVEIPICKTDEECQARIKQMPTEHRPLEIKGPDPKWRFFWRIGERPKEGGFEALNAEPVVPAAFPQWKQTMDRWGHLMLASVTTCAEMAAVGFGLERDAISSFMELGPHLLAPTGSDLSRHRTEGTVLAGYHNDLNLFTIHGKSRYPGLYVWLRDGTKMLVKIPDGCLLVQAGMQIERLTGGAVEAGMHEVVVLPSTVQAAELQEAAGRPAWRISSTLFAHTASAKVLRPLGDFATPTALEEFPPITAGEQVMSILQKINLAKPGSSG